MAAEISTQVENDSVLFLRGGFQTWLSEKTKISASTSGLISSLSSTQNSEKLSEYLTVIVPQQPINLLDWDVCKKGVYGSKVGEPCPLAPSHQMAPQAFSGCQEVAPSTCRYPTLCSPHVSHSARTHFPHDYPSSYLQGV